MANAVSLSPTGSTTNTGMASATNAADMQKRFLTLLVAQINNQDPMNPMDNAQMTSQMAQINTVSGIEQLNDTVKNLTTQFSTLQQLQASGVTFSGIGGQRAATTTSIPASMDGQTVWMNVPSGNGVFQVDLAAGNTGSINADAGQVIDPTQVTGHSYQISFTSPTQYQVSDTSTTPPTVVKANQIYTSGQAIVFEGLSIVVNGKPQAGDALQVSPSTPLNVFELLDDAIASIRNDQGSVLSHQLSRALTQIDAATNRLESARMVAGDLLNRADTIDSNQQTKSLQLQADRSRAEDLDMPQAISEFQSQQTGYDSALKTYAAVQRLSLFNYIS